MKAVRIARTGGPEVLDYIEVPTPRPGPGEVLVRTEWMGVGIPDILVRTGKYLWMPPLPAVIGIEAAGRIAELGKDVDAALRDRPVFVSARELPVRGNCYAEYIRVPASAVYFIPEGVDLALAACLSNYQVAWHLLNSATQGYRFASVLVWAAAGGVGSAAIQLAKAAGKRVIAIAGGAEKCARARAHGADATIDHKSEDVGQRVHDLTAGQGVDLILDPVGGPAFGKNFAYLAPLGLVINYGLLDGPPDPSYAQAIYARFGDSLGLRFFSMHVFDGKPERRRAAMQELLPLLAEGRIRPDIAARLPLAEARRAHELLESGTALGKILLQP